MNVPTPTPPPEGNLACSSSGILSAEARRTFAGVCCSTLREPMRTLFANDCAYCHGSGGNSPRGGAPRIEFDDIEALERRLARTSGTVGDLKEVLWDRVTRHSGAWGHMPRDNTPITREQKLGLREWLNSIPGTCSGN